MENIEIYITDELTTGCHRRPTKRMALWLAKILCRDRVHPDDLGMTLWLVDNLKDRIEQPKV